MNKVAIFIKSYRGDFEWLGYCLRSILKYVKGHAETVVALPAGHGLPLTAERIVVADEWPDKAKANAPSRGYYHQMFVKLCADLHCPDASHILFVDSDCVFTKPFDVAQMFGRDGRPKLLRRTWTQAGQGGIWRAPAEHALGFPCEYDTMVCHPSIYRSVDLADLRYHIERNHGCPFERYVRNREHFIEFVTIGNFILKTRPEEYEIVDHRDGCKYPDDVIKQSWSWGGMNSGTRALLEKIVS